MQALQRVLWGENAAFDEKKSNKFGSKSHLSFFLLPFSSVTSIINRGGFITKTDKSNWRETNESRKIFPSQGKQHDC